MSEPATNPAAEAAAAATSFPAPTISLPLGLEVLRTYSGALILVEIVSGSVFLFVFFFFNYYYCYYLMFLAVSSCARVSVATATK